MSLQLSFSHGLACLVLASVAGLAGCSNATDSSGSGGAAPKCGGCSIPFCGQPPGACDCGCLDGDIISARAQTYACKNGCFSPRGSGGGGAGGTGSAGAAGAQANGGVTNGAGSGGTSAVPGATCPDHPPAKQAACDSLGETCAYEECASAGRTIARCQNGAWSVENAPCADTVICSGSPGSMSCAKGQICLTLASGAVFTECVPNDCKDGPIGCNCLQNCPGNCSLIAGTEGVSISCNTCPSGQCP